MLPSRINFGTYLAAPSCQYILLPKLSKNSISTKSKLVLFQKQNLVLGCHATLVPTRTLKKKKKPGKINHLKHPERAPDYTDMFNMATKSPSSYPYGTIIKTSMPRFPS